MGNNYLYLVWKSPLSGKRYVIGRLNRADEYSFEYSDECSMARKDGLNEYDGYELLKKSGGRLPIDSYSFEEPDYVEKVN